MNVKDLIEHLQKFDSDMRVVVNGNVEDGLCDCGTPEEATIVPDSNGMDWQGPHLQVVDRNRDYITPEKYTFEQVVYINCSD